MGLLQPHARHSDGAGKALRRHPPIDAERSRAPVVIVHDLRHAQAALAASEAASAAVTLLSPAGASAYWGPLFFQAMIRLAAEAHPGAVFEAILDCGDRPGDVLAALRQGVKTLAFHGEGPVRDRLAAIAAATQGRVSDRPSADLDCAQAADPVQACGALLSLRPC